MTDHDNVLRHLLDAAKEGDGVALRELVRQTQPVLTRVITALSASDEVEDLVQETYLRAMSSIASFRGASAVETWLISIARHVCADQVRRNQRRRRLVDRLVQFAVETDAPPPGEGISAVLDGLDVDRREAFLLTQMAGLSYEEAADVLGVPIGTIRSRVARARRDLLIAVERMAQ